MSPLDNQPAPQGSRFATTQWSLVLAAGDKKSPDVRAALETLCRTYWYPLYVYARRRVNDREQAQDLTQEFFAQFLEKNALAGATSQRGRFRSFLLTSLKNFLTNQWNRQQAAKRGGGRSIFSLDFDSQESRFNFQPAHELTAEVLYDRQWALTLLDLVLQRLRAEFVAAGKSREFELLKDFLVGSGPDGSYTAVAKELEIGPAAARQAAHRLRKRYRELLRSEVAQTLDDAEEVEDEIRRLFENLAS